MFMRIRTNKKYSKTVDDQRGDLKSSQREPPNHPQRNAIRLTAYILW